MTETRPFIRLRGRSIMALVLSPELPLQGWLTSLDAQIERAPNFFDNRPVIVDCGSLPSNTPDVAALMHAIVSRGIHIIGMEVRPRLLAWARGLGTQAAGRRQNRQTDRHRRTRGSAARRRAGANPHVQPPPRPSRRRY
jgi:septum site-determining protein MinC